MNCLHCGKEISPIRQLQDEDFCSATHRRLHTDRLRKALSNLAAPEPAPTRSAGFIVDVLPHEGKHAAFLVTDFFLRGYGASLPSAWNLRLDEVAGSSFSDFLPDATPAPQPAADSAVWHDTMLAFGESPWNGTAPIPAIEAGCALPVAEAAWMAADESKCVTLPALAGAFPLSVAPCLPAATKAALGRIAVDAAITSLAGGTPVPAAGMATPCVPDPQWLSPPARLSLPVEEFAVADEGEAGERPVAVPPPAEWRPLRLKPVAGHTAGPVAALDSLPLEAQPPVLRAPSADLVHQLEAAALLPVEPRGAQRLLVPAQAADSPVAPQEAMLLPAMALPLTVVAPPPLAAFAAGIESVHAAAAPLKLEAQPGTVAPVAQLPQPNLELAQPPVPDLADLLPDVNGRPQWDTDSLLAPAVLETPRACLPDVAGTVRGLAAPLLPAVPVLAPASCPVDLPGTLALPAMPDFSLRLPAADLAVPAAEVKGPAEGVQLEVSPQAEDAAPVIAAHAAGTGDDLALPVAEPVAPDAAVAAAGGVGLLATPLDVEQPPAEAAWIDGPVPALQGARADLSTAVETAGFQLSLHAAAPAPAAFSPAVPQALLAQPEVSLHVPAAAALQLEPELGAPVEVLFYVQRGQPAPARREQWVIPRVATMLPRLTFGVIDLPVEPTRLPIDEKKSGRRWAYNRSDAVLWGRGLAAGIAVCAFLWVGSMAIRSPRNAGAEPVARPTDVAVSTPPVKPSGGFVQQVRQVIANRARLELDSDFHNGKQFWDGTKADLGKGWQRHPDGYSVPGQLALFRPSLRLADYKLEFMGQIENRSMGWVVRAQDTGNYYAMKFNIVEPGLRPIISVVRYAVVNGKRGRKTEIPLQVMVHNHMPYRVAVEVRGNRFVTSVEGEQVDSWTDDTLRAGGVGFFGEGAERARLYWMKVTNNDDLLGKVCAYLAGTRGNAGTEQAWMYGGRPDMVFLAGFPAVVDRKHGLALAPAWMWFERAG